jgi:hypothetical protein
MWRIAPAKPIGYALANVTPQAQRFDLPLAIGGLTGPYLVCAVRDGGYEVLHEGNALPSLVQIELPPWGVGLVAIVPASSQEAAYVRAQPPATPTSSPTPAPHPGPCRGSALVSMFAAVLIPRATRLTASRHRTASP